VTSVAPTSLPSSATNEQLLEQRTVCAVDDLADLAHHCAMFPFVVPVSVRRYGREGARKRGEGFVALERRDRDIRAAFVAAGIMLLAIGLYSSVAIVAQRETDPLAWADQRCNEQLKKDTDEQKRQGCLAEQRQLSDWTLAAPGLLVASGGIASFVVALLYHGRRTAGALHDEGDSPPSR
jgi:hypothetical protein